MPKFVKWLLAVLAVIIVLTMACMIVAIIVLDVDQYKPIIEKQATEAIGRPLTLGGDVNLSVFPWIGVSISDVHLGNPPEFQAKDMVGIDFFEVRVKLLPLLTGHVQVKRFVIKGAKINLVKNKAGQLNLAGIPPAGEAETEKTGKRPPEEPTTSDTEFPIKDLKCKQFAITDGSLVWLDMTSDIRKEVNQINLVLENVSLDKAMGFVFSAVADNHPISVKGKLGPLESREITITDGVLTLDDSEMRFNARAKDFDKPDLTFDATLDNIDLDRYFPPPPETEPAKSPQSAPPNQETAAIDYSPLRKLLLEGRIKIGELKARNTRMQNIDIQITAKNGIIRTAPVSIDLYSGKIKVDGTFNVQGKNLKSVVDLNIADVQTGTLLKDFLKKDLIEGVLNAGIKLNFSGDQPNRVRETLNGEGELKFNDGAIVGIDLANMVRNVKAAFSGQGTREQKPRTDFSELLVPLTIKNGLANIDGSKLNSPLIRIVAGGKAHVAEETLNLRIDPKFVATLVGQGDTVEQRSGVTVPVLITGTFAKPKFAPDLKSLLSTSVPGTEKITENLKETQKKVTDDVQKKARDLIKNLPF
jgi:uncharacterized protein involved in outer membrane biogenesis